MSVTTGMRKDAGKEARLIFVFVLAVVAGFLLFSGTGIDMFLPPRADSQPVADTAGDKTASYPDGFYFVERLDSSDPVFTLLRPNSSGFARTYEGTAAYYVSTNRYGLREESLSLENPPNVTRILVVGDSFVFGMGVNRSKRFTDIVERQLNQNSPGRYEVISAGVPGWGMRDYHAYLHSRGLRFNPDIVVISFNIADELSREEEAAIWAEEGTAEQAEQEEQELQKEKSLESESDIVLYASKILNATDVNIVFFAYRPFTGTWYRPWLESFAANHSRVFFVPSPEILTEVDSSNYTFSASDRHYNELGHRWLAEQLYTQMVSQPDMFAGNHSP